MTPTKMPYFTYEYKKAWLQKFGSLFVSAKMIFFWTIVTLSTFLLCFGIIPPTTWGYVVIAVITNVCAFRGIIQVAEVLQKYKNNIDLESPLEENKKEEEIKIIKG